MTSVGGTTNFRPEVAANLSGGGFSFYFPTPAYQLQVVERYVERNHQEYDGLYKYARFPAHCRDQAHHYIVICAALVVVATPTSPRKRSNANFSRTARCFTWTARSALFRCVFPYSCRFWPTSSVLKYPADGQRPDSGGHGVTA